MLLFCLRFVCFSGQGRCATKLNACGTCKRDNKLDNLINSDKQYTFNGNSNSVFDGTPSLLYCMPLGNAIRTRKSYSVNCIHIRITSFLDRMLLPFIVTPTPTTPVFFSGGANNQNDLFSNFTRTSEWNLFEVRSGIKLHPTESRSSFNARHETDLHENCSQKFYSCDSLDWCISCSFYEHTIYV